MAHEAGKGGKPRPIEVPRTVYDKRWEETFSKKDNNDGKTKTTELPTGNGKSTTSS